MNGNIKFYLPEPKKFGFIIGDDGKDYFFHINEWTEEGKPQKGDSVSFDPKPGKKGEIATKIKLA